MRTNNEDERDITGKRETGGALLQDAVLSMDLVFILAELEGKFPAGHLDYYEGVAL
jgi:hypothetical protein